MSTTAAAEAAPKSRPEVKGGVVAYLMLSNAGAAADYYKNALGAEEVARMPAHDNPAKLLHVHLYINNGSLMLSDAFPEHGHPLVPPQAFTLTLEVDDADRWWSRMKAEGAEVIMPVTDMFWGARYGALRDPFGVAWGFNQPNK